MNTEAIEMIEKLNKDEYVRKYTTLFQVYIDENPKITGITTDIIPQKYSIKIVAGDSSSKKETRIESEIKEQEQKEIFAPFVQKNEEKILSYYDNFQKCECAKLAQNLKNFSFSTDSSSYISLIQSLSRLTQHDYLDDRSLAQKISTFEKQPLHDEELFFRILDAMKNNVDNMREKEDVRKEQAKKEKEEKEQREKEKKEKEEKEKKERERQEAEEKRKKEAESELQSKIQRYK